MVKIHPFIFLIPINDPNKALTVSQNKQFQISPYVHVIVGKKSHPFVTVSAHNHKWDSQSLLSQTPAMSLFLLCQAPCLCN